MQNVVLRAPALVFLVAVSAASGEDAACAATDAASQSLYSHAAATLTISTANPPATDMRVQIRGRSRLTYSSKDELPEFIGAPTDAAFPLVAHAGNLTEADAAPPIQEAAPTIADYANAAKSLFADKLVSHGAVLLREPPLADSADYSAFVSALGWDAVKLAGGGTQRSDIQSNVRSASDDEPPEQTIEPHMDMAHSVAHPKRIGFFMAAGPPPGAGGETVLTNMRAVYRELDALGVPQAFEEHGRRRLPQAAVVVRAGQPHVHVAEVLLHERAGAGARRGADARPTPRASTSTARGHRLSRGAAGGAPAPVDRRADVVQRRAHQPPVVLRRGGARGHVGRLADGHRRTPTARPSRCHHRRHPRRRLAGLRCDAPSHRATSSSSTTCWRPTAACRGPAGAAQGAAHRALGGSRARAAARTGCLSS